MRASQVLAVFALCGLGATRAVPTPPDPKTAPVHATATIDGWVKGKKVQPGPEAIEPGAEAAAKLLAASNLVNFLNPGQAVDKGMWQREVVSGMENGRQHVRVRFANPQPVKGSLNGAKATLTVSEVVFFEPADSGPVCLWARAGDAYYFANQLAGRETLVKWLAKVQGQ